MAERADVNASTVGRIWRTFGLQPHIVESFKISDDPLFIEKVRDIVGLYLNPPDHAVVLSFDEKPQIQALERAQPILPMDMGRPERQTHNYIRHGTVALFAALNVATGHVVAQTKEQHRSRDFVSFLREIDERVDPTLTVHVILDNLSARKSPLVKRWACPLKVNSRSGTGLASRCRAYTIPRENWSATCGFGVRRCHCVAGVGLYAVVRITRPRGHSGVPVGREAADDRAPMDQDRALAARGRRG